MTGEIMADKKAVRETVESALREVTQVDFKDIPDEVKLGSMDLDSLDWAELQLYLENDLKVSLPDDAPIKLQTTVGELITLLDGLLGQVEQC